MNKLSLNLSLISSTGEKLGFHRFFVLSTIFISQACLAKFLQTAKELDILGLLDGPDDTRTRDTINLKDHPTPKISPSYGDVILGHINQESPEVSGKKSCSKLTEDAENMNDKQS